MIFYVSIQIGLLEFLKLLMGILQYQPTLDKTISTQAASDNGDYSQQNNSQHVTNTFYTIPQALRDICPQYNTMLYHKNFTLIIRCTYNSTKRVSIYEKGWPTQNLFWNQPSSNPNRSITIKR